MSITIPLADVSPGVSAPRIRVEADQGAGVVGQFGARLAQIGETMEADRLDREIGRVRVDLARDLGEARLRLEAETDPDALEAGWQATAAEMRTAALARVDKRNAERAELMFDEMAGAHALRLGARALDLRQGEYRINLSNLGDTLQGQAGAMDPDTRAAGMDAYADALAEAVAAGAMDPEAANDLLRAQRDGMDRAAALRALDENPASLIERLDAGEFEGLDGVYREGLRARASSTLAADAARAASEAERTATARAKIIGDELAQVAQIAGGGRTPAQLAILDDPEAQAHPKYPEALAAVELMAEQPRLPMMTVAELDALIAEERAQPIVRSYQAERLKVLEDARDAAAEGWGKDPIGFAEGAGFAVPELPEFDATDPEAFREGLRARAAYGTALEAQGYGRVAIPLSLEERADIKAAATIDADPAERAALAMEVAGAFGAGAASEIAADPVFGHMGGFLARGGPRGLAEEVFRGQQAIQAETVILPPVKDRVPPVFETIETVLGDLPGGERLQGEITAAADALYAARVRRTDPAGDIDEAEYAKALHAVLGGTGEPGRRGATGGIQPVRGAPTILPAGVTPDAVEDALDRIGTSLTGAMRRDDTEVFARQIAAIGAGAVPEIDGVPITPRDLRRLTLRAVGPDAYRLEFRGQVLADAEGNPWTMSLRALLREAGQ